MTTAILLECLDGKWYPGLNRKITEAFCKFADPFSNFVGASVYDNEVYHSAVCIFVNLFHMAVLLCHSMRKSSIFLIMAAVALMDIFSLASMFCEKFISFYQRLYPCYPETTDYNLMMLDMIRQHFKNFTRRCSTWLSLSIAIIRALLIRYPMSVRFEKLSRPRTIIYVIGGVLFIIIPNSIGDVLSLDVLTFDKNFDCKISALSPRYYSVEPSKLFRKTHRLFRPIIKIAEALISKVIPCFLFPLATIVLIKEIRKASIRRNALSSNSASSSQTNTSYLVLAQTFIFFIAEFPLGIVFLLQYPTFGSNFDVLLGAFERFFTSVLMATTATHMFICIFMSSQYRLAAQLFVRGGYPLKVNKSEFSITLTQRM